MAEGLTFRQIWKDLPQERRQEMAVALWNAAPASAQNEVLSAMEKAFNFRCASLKKLPPERKAHMLAGLAANNELMAGTVVRNYFFNQHRPMLVAFLDALGVTHDKGTYDRSAFPEPPSTEQLQTALSTLKQTHDPAVVDLYTAVLRADDAELWANLPPLSPAGEPVT